MRIGCVALGLALVGCGGGRSAAPTDTEALIDTSVAEDSHGSGDTGGAADTDAETGADSDAETGGDAGGDTATDPATDCVLASKDVDEEDDGVLDYRELYAYDDLDRLVVTQADDGADGVIDSVVTDTYGERGGVIVEVTQFGWPDSVGVRRKTFDERGAPLREELVVSGEGAIEESTEWTYGPAGRILKRAYEREGVPSGSTTWTWGADPNSVSIVYDREDDGIPDGTWDRVYDEDGFVEDVAYDYSGDGVLDFTTHVAFDGHTFTSVADKSQSGRLTSRTTTAYNPQGLPVRSVLDLRANGSVDGLRLTAYRLDGQILVDYTHLGPAIHQVTNTYDADGHVLTRDFDDNADGSIDEHDEWTYNEDGNPLSALIGGLLETWEYDEDGRLLVSLQELETGPHSVRRQRTTYDYTGR